MYMSDSILKIQKSAKIIDFCLWKFRIPILDRQNISSELTLVVKRLNFSLNIYMAVLCFSSLLFLVYYITSHERYSYNSYHISMKSYIRREIKNSKINRYYIHNKFKAKNTEFKLVVIAGSVRFQIFLHFDTNF